MVATRHIKRNALAGNTSGGACCGDAIRMI